MSKTIYLLLGLFFASTTLSANTSGQKIMEPKPRETEKPTLHNGLEQLNQAMESTLRLSAEQFRAIRKANRAFWKERQAILENTALVARHTALLAAWDRWARQLESILDKYQYRAFLEWQYQVSPLNEQPY
ncbi:MAG: hypothetical protein KDD10_30385 [Phaeodactylibacter sp.]|nr:hypothetical protein [Phaeodactylibacter sp.]MCB9297334.1 hypothetical protein [Lewinellaceae bacterium]